MTTSAQTEGDKSRAEQKNLTSRAEAIARIIDPYAWSFADRHSANPIMVHEVAHETRPSLNKAHEIMALPPLLDGGCSSARDLRSDADAACSTSVEALEHQQVKP
jgi:hypothetical protein